MKGKARGRLSEHETKKLMQGAFILTVAAVATKVLSAIYRVPFQNIVGDTGFYIYQQVYPIYGIAVALSISGFPVMISKMLAEAAELQKESEVKKVIQAAYQVLFGLGFLLFAGFYFGAPKVAEWMGDPLLSPLIKMVSFVFLFLPLLSVWRGFFQGKGEMLPTAVSQVTEQTIRVISILVLSYFLISNGYTLYDTGIGALLGSVAGSLAALIVLFLFVLFRQRDLLEFKVVDWKIFKKVAKTIIFQGTAICMSSMLLVLLQLIDSLNLYATLVSSGIDGQLAKELKGVYDRGQPLVQLGIVFATSLSWTLVPMVTAAAKKGQMDVLHGYIQTTIKISIIVGAGAAVGLMNIISPVNVMLFENDKGSSVIAIFVFAIFFCSIILTSAAVLQGLGSIYKPVRYIGIGLVIKFFGNHLLIPLFGTMGASFASVCSLGVIAFLLMRQLKKRLTKPLLPKRFYLHLLLSLTAMSIVLQLWMMIFAPGSGRLVNTSVALTAVLVGGFCYFVIVIRKRLLDEKELEYIPFFGKLLLVLRK